MSVATLTDDPLDKMTSINNAPSIRAIVIGKGEDFSNKEGLPDGAAIMPQVGARPCVCVCVVWSRYALGGWLAHALICVSCGCAWYV